MGGSQQEANRAVLHKGNTGVSRALQTEYPTASELIATVGQSGKVGSPDLKPQLPQRPDLRPFPALPNMFLVLDKEHSVHQSLGEVLDQPSKPSILLFGGEACLR